MSKVVHSELELESKEKANEDLEIHPQINLDNDTFKDPFPLRRKNELISYDKGVITDDSPNITLKGDMAQDMEKFSMGAIETSHEKGLESYANPINEDTHLEVVSTPHQVGPSEDSQARHLEEMENHMLFTSSRAYCEEEQQEDPNSSYPT